MAILNSVWTDRVQHWLRTLKADFYRPLGRIELEAFRTMEHLPYEEAQQRKYTPVKTGFTWGNTWEYCWFRGKFELPENAEGKRIVLNLNPGGESTLFVNGEEFGTYRADWIAQPHHYMVDNTITRDALPGSRYEICMETYAGHYFPNCETGYCATGPVLPGSYQDPLAEGSRRILGECTYGIWCEDAYQLYMDVETLYRLLEAVDENSLRAAKIAQALKQFTLDVDFEQPQEEEEACYRNARGGPERGDAGSKRFQCSGFLGGRKRASGSCLALAGGGNGAEDRAYLCRTAAADGGISGIPLYSESACRI